MKYKNKIFILFFSLVGFLTIFLMFSFLAKYKAQTYEENLKQYKKLSNCVAPTNVMEKALKADVKATSEGKEAKFTKIISFLAAKYLGNWSQFKEKDLDEIVEKLCDEEKEKDLMHIYSNYPYFKEFYETLFSQYVGKYTISKTTENEEQSNFFEERYGLKAYSPIAYGYKPSFCDDFDNEVNFAKQKGHFGNDIAVKKGTPFVAVESGIIDRIHNEGKINQIELKSFDGKRRYIYSNCNEKKPFADGIKKGAVVFAGQLLGFVGCSDCCEKGGAKILNCPYLHFAIKISLKTENEAKREIYVDAYNILKFLEHHKVEFIKQQGVLQPKHICRDEEYMKYTKKDEEDEM